MRYLLLGGALLFASSTSFAAGFDACRQHFFKGISPEIKTTAPGELRELCFDGFAILHSGQSKTAVYVAEHLTRAKIAAQLKREDKFYEEARLPQRERARLEDYRSMDDQGNRYDRGHLAPAADMGTPEALAQSFSPPNELREKPRP